MEISNQISRLARILTSRSRRALTPRRNGLRRLHLETMEERCLMATIDLNDVFPATQLTRILGSQASDFSGRSVSNAGDVNGDGFDDFIVGAFLAATGSLGANRTGKSYVIFGGSSLPATITLSDTLSTTNPGVGGFTILGQAASDRSGRSVSGAGDVNGDGFDDLIVGAFGADPASAGTGDNQAGKSYVIFGGSSLPATITLSDTLSSTNSGVGGFTILGQATADKSGYSVSSAGDVNGDGFDDLIVGAYGADPGTPARERAGKSYVIFGGSSLPATIPLSDTLSTTNPGVGGLTILGQATYDQSGRSVSSAGDVNGDGFDDLIVGAPNAYVAANSAAGKSYVIFGGNGFTNSILPSHLGGSGSDSLQGDTSTNRINGAGGDDIVSGGGGADVLLGGQGNDIFVINDASFQRIVGGTGRNSLFLNNPTNVGFTLNLTTIPNNRLRDIEEIDISGFNANNKLILNHREVLNLSSKSNTLIVRRNNGDVVNIGSGWTYGGAETIGPGTFDLFTQGQATLKLQRINALIAARNIFYNNATGANLSSAGAANNAIASDKSPLLPGNTSTFANYTNYSRGLNGLIVDINDLPASTTNSQILASLQFAQWNGISAAGFAALPSAAVPTATILSGSGVDGSARVKFTFQDNSLQNTWLRVTVVANTGTGLAVNDVFYFGNVIGEMNTGNTSTRLRVNATDIGAVRSNQSTAADSASSTNIYDMNRDGRVNATDTGIVRSNQQTAGIVAPLTIPAAGALAAGAGIGDGSEGDEEIAPAGAAGLGAPVVGVPSTGIASSNIDLNKQVRRPVVDASFISLRNASRDLLVLDSAAIEVVRPKVLDKLESSSQREPKNPLDAKLTDEFFSGFWENGV